jgi:iron-sulfur cluster assembly accessory protein
MLRRDISFLASRIARVASGSQCSTSSVAPSLSALENAWSQACISEATSFPSHFNFRSLNRIVASMRSSLSSSSCSFATSASPSKQDDGLTISEAAVARLQQLQKDAGTRPVFLRLTVEGGGCSGFQYEFTLEEQGPKKGDQVYQVGGTSVLCDDVSMEFLRGATVDFESDLMRSAFVVNTKLCCCCCYFLPVVFGIFQILLTFLSTLFICRFMIIQMQTAHVAVGAHSLLNKLVYGDIIKKPL